jgi:isochorismate synthase EntC
MKLVLALVFCLGFALARVEEWSWMDNMDNMDSVRNIDDYEFQSGREFHYVYNGQMTTGIPGSSKQHSGTRVQALVTFVFKNSNTCLMKINKVRMGKMNHDLANPRKVAPFEMFEEMQMEHKYKQQLLLPIKFSYNGGLIRNLVLDGEDQPWSVNIKRGILNLLQVNIQKQGIMEESFEEERLTNVHRPTEIDNSKFFRVMEETVEGECETLYTITKQPNMRSYNRNVMNVTKSINFEKCLKRPQIKYNFRFSDPCPTCESKYNDDQKFLKSSTVAFYNITGTVNKFMIDSARIESEYTFLPFSEESNVIVTYVNQTLVLVKTTPITHRVEEPRQAVQSDSDMVFTLDWDVAKEKFFMEDDTTMMRRFNLPQIHNKIEIIGSLLQKLVSRMQESVEDDAPKYLDRLITLFRLCTHQEIKQIHDTFYRSTQFNHEQQKKIRDILPSIQALCGTKVCVQHLVEKIRNNEIPTLTAILAVKDLINIRTPSKLIIEELLKLAECEVVQRHYALKQSVWLTIGSLMNGLCSNGVDQWAREIKGKSQRLWARQMKQTTDKLFWTKDIKEHVENMLSIKMEEKNEKFCPRHLKEKYVQLLISKLQTTKKWEERLTYLKALGNAGLDLSIFELEKIVLNRERQYSTLIRTEAILAMRQLKDIMPKKIQKVLMPVLLNKLESPTVRIACSYMILQTLPKLPVLDIIAKMVQSERNVQVSSFVHSYMETLANSTNPCEAKLVSDMRMALRHTRKIDTTPFGYSKITRIPIHSVLHKVGLDLELASSFKDMSYIPRYLTATLHSNFLGFWNKYLVSFGLVTEGLENMMHRFSRDHFSQEQDMSSDSTFDNMLNMKDYEEEFNNMFSTLNFNDETTKEPKALLYMKFKDQDYGFLPIKREFIRSMMSEGKFNLREIESKLRQGVMLNFNKASMLHEMTYKIPTTMGLPLTVTTKIPVVMSVHGKLQAVTSERSLRSFKINVNLKPSFVAHLVVDVQSWCPIVNHGLRVVHKLKSFKPIDAKVEVDLHSTPMNVRLTIRPPTTRRELFSFETKPMTYTRVWSKLQEPEHKVIMGEEMKNVHTFNKCIGRKVFGVEFCLRGKVHQTPSNSIVGKPFFPLSGPNKVVLTVEPGHDVPQEIVINLSGKLLSRTMESIRQPLFREFENLNSFDEDREDTYFRTENEHTRRTNKYNPFSYFYSEDKSFENRMSEPLTTTLKIDIQARPRHFSFDLVHLLDLEQGQCKVQLKLKSSPTSEHNQGFVACLNSETKLPKYTRDITENKVMTNARLTWGRTSCKQENHITLKSKLIKSHLENMFESDMSEHNMYESREYEPMYETSYKNEFSPESKQVLKYQVDIDYNNVPFMVKNYTNKVFLALKHYFYEQSDVSQIMVRNPEKKIRVIVTVDPIHKQCIDLKIKTPKENTHIHNIPTPYFLTSLKSKRSHMKNFWSRQEDNEFTSFDNIRDFYRQDMNEDIEFPLRETEEDCDDYTCQYKRQSRYNNRDWTMDQTRRFDNEYNTFEQNENEYETEFDRSNTNMRPILKHKLVEHEDKVCVSLQRIPECPVNCQIEKEVEKRVSFHCLNRNSPLVEKLETKVRYGERIPQIERLTPSMTRMEVVPMKCTPMY